MGKFYDMVVTWIVSFFVEKSAVFAFRVGLVVTVIAVILAFMTAFTAATYLLLDGIKVAVPAEVDRVWGWFMPPNTAACLVAIVTARFARFALDFKFKVATLKARMTASG